MQHGDLGFTLSLNIASGIWPSEFCFLSLFLVMILATLLYFHESRLCGIYRPLNTFVVPLQRSQLFVNNYRKLLG